MLHLSRILTESRRGSLIATALCLAGAAFSTAAHAAATDTFTAQFNVNRSSVPLGTSTFSLKPGSEPNCYIYGGHADPNALVQMFIGQISDETHFCVVDGAIRPQSFRHHIDGNTRKSYTLTFNWANQQVVYQTEAGKSKTLPLVAGAQDPLSLQIAARRWLANTADPAQAGTRAFPLVEKNSIETYELQVTDGGTIDTPAGSFKTLQVSRTGTHKHDLRLWLARDADWIPVKVDQQQNGSSEFAMQLTALQR